MKRLITFVVLFLILTPFAFAQDRSNYMDFTITPNFTSQKLNYAEVFNGVNKQDAFGVTCAVTAYGQNGLILGFSFGFNGTSHEISEGLKLLKPEDHKGFFIGLTIGFRTWID